MNKGLEALEKIDHTVCLNSLSKHIEWNIDKEEHIDCESIDEFVECYDIIEEELRDGEKTKQLLENLQTSRDKVKVPLSAIFEGLSQEERHTLIEHIYYSQAPWKEKYDALEKDYEEMQHSFNIITCQNGDLLIYKNAVEIIKQCLVSEFKLFEKDGEYLILFYFDEIHELTFKLKNKEEYDLLKEVLADGK